MKIVYFDCFSGAAGDMIVASLIDAGADRAALEQGLKTLSLKGYTLTIEKTTKQGFAATRFLVKLDPTERQPHRHLADVVRTIDGSSLPQDVKSRAIAVFERLATAEAEVHGTSIEAVHFHEVGAVDALLDVVGAVYGLHLLGADRVVCSRVAVGSGTVRCQHGVMPVPAPATAKLLVGKPIYSGPEACELTTPTGAAILTTLASEFGPMPELHVSSIGCGAGTRDGDTLPNLLRVFVGTTPGAGDGDMVAVLETNIDDATGEVIGFAIERLLDEGALDAFAVPIQMKKSRPGVILTVVCDQSKVANLEKVIFCETPTFGIRRRTQQRTLLRRRHRTVATPYGTIRVKVGERAGMETAAPEYEDCRAAAVCHGVAVREVMAAAMSAWRDTGGKCD